MKPTAVAIVPLEDGLVVKKDLLGYVTKRIQITNTVQLEVCFPVEKERDELKIIKLGSPYDGIEFCSKDIDWGGTYHVDNNNDTTDFRISTLLIKLYSKIDESTLATQPFANKCVSTFLKILEFTKITALCYHSLGYTRVTPDNFPLSNWKDENGKIHETGLVQLSPFHATDIFTIEDVEYALGNSLKEISLPYQILHIARRCLIARDYRGCVLNCASAIEIPFQQLIDRYYDDNAIPTELRKFIKLQGIGKKVELCKKLGLPIEFTKEYGSVMEKRNEVIHEGKLLEYGVAKPLLDTTFRFMQEQNIPLFV